MKSAIILTIVNHECTRENTKSGEIHLKSFQYRIR